MVRRLARMIAPGVLCLALLGMISSCGQSSRSMELRVAVASNFAPTMAALAEAYLALGGGPVLVASGATGKHYAQIINGAPFDLFFAADLRRPQLLEEQGRAVPGSRFTYAVGSLVLWSPSNGLVDPAGEVLHEQGFRHLAIANPKLAPYGRAAQEVLQELGLWDELQAKLVRGENIGQAFQFVASGNAQLGLVAKSQITTQGQPTLGSFWRIPAELYTPIEQQAVQLSDHPAAQGFLEFVRSDAARAIIRSHGYSTP